TQNSGQILLCRCARCGEGARIWCPWYAPFGRFGTFASLTFVRSLRSLLQGARLQRQKRAERAYKRPKAVPHLRPPALAHRPGPSPEMDVLAMSARAARTGAWAL